jgi:Ca2+-binding RTX toxin-like protein
VVKVSYNTVNGSARAGVDYVNTSGILEIPIGETNATIEVPIQDDNLQERRDESFKLVLSDPINVNLNSSEAIATITDTLTTDVTTTLPAGVENLLLTGTDNIDGTGNAGDNQITGNSGNNRLDGLAGNDTLSGGDGDDTYVLDSVSDKIIEKRNSGVDTIEANFSYTLKGQLENLTLTGKDNLDGTGNNFDNILTGNRGNNTLTGYKGDDLLNGDRGNDTLIGGQGDDTITTGGGKDIIVFNSKQERVDTITDFNRRNDLIQIKASGFGGGLTAGELSSEQFVLGTSANDADDRFIYDQPSRQLWFDQDGIGKSNPLELAIFSNNTALNASNFVIV